jgi:hypothetical protein
MSSVWMDLPVLMQVMAESDATGRSRCLVNCELLSIGWVWLRD